MTPRSSAVHKIREQLQIVTADLEAFHEGLIERIRAADQLLSLVDDSVVCPLEKDCPKMHGLKKKGAI